MCPQFVAVDGFAGSPLRSGVRVALGCGVVAAPGRDRCSIAVSWFPVGAAVPEGSSRPRLPCWHGLSGICLSCCAAGAACVATLEVRGVGVWLGGLSDGGLVERGSRTPDGAVLG